MRNLKLYKLLLVATFFCACVDRQSETTKSKLLSSSMNDYLTSCESNGFNGAVLIVKGDSIILNKGYGFANKEQSVAYTSKTIFDICSVTKQFTGAAILKLVEDEKLKLTDSLSKYFKDLPLDKKNITIHQLLTHSGGFGHGIGESDFDHIAMSDYFIQLFDIELLFKPGEKYAYSNSGYSILGRIIEIVSGESYEGYVREELFNRAGMKQTGYLIPNWDTTMIANEYSYNVLHNGNNIARYQQDGKISWSLMANGGINSTQEDMYKWFLALKSNTVLNKFSIEKLTTPYILEYEGESSYYAYGWTIFQSDRGTKIISHDGYNGISYYKFTWFPEEDAVILFSTNSSTRESIRMPDELEKYLFDENYQTKPFSKNMVSVLISFIESYSGSLGDLGKELKQKFEVILDEPTYLNRLSGIYLRHDKTDIATVVAELNTQLFPDNGNVWDTMGDVYVATKQDERAIESYKKALEFSPENDDCYWCDNSSSQLEKLDTLQ